MSSDNFSTLIAQNGIRSNIWIIVIGGCISDTLGQVLQWSEALLVSQSHVNLIAIPDHLLWCRSNRETLSSLWPSVLGELVNSCNELSLQEEESVICTDTDLISLRDIAII